MSEQEAAAAPEEPIQGAVFHCEKNADRASYTVGMELPDAMFLACDDGVAAFEYLDGLLAAMRSLFIRAWEKTHP